MQGIVEINVDLYKCIIGVHAEGSWADIADYHLVESEECVDLFSKAATWRRSDSMDWKVCIEGFLRLPPKYCTLDWMVGIEGLTSVLKK